MKKKIWITLSAVLFVLAILFFPIPKGTAEDGGTREYVALTYKIVDWNRICGREVYEKTRVYFGADRNKSMDELWEMEKAGIDKSFDVVTEDSLPPITGEKVFYATVLEIADHSVLVRPLDGEAERNSSDQISFGTSKLEKIEAEVGSVVKIHYDGNIMETYPAQITPSSWSLCSDLRTMEFTDPWLEKSEDKKYGNDIFHDIVITRIYSNCFFARTVIPMPYEIKMNGTLSEDWCVGDQVLCTYENTFYDPLRQRAEADLITIEESTFQPDPMVAYKPVIYLYPERKEEVSVSLSLEGNLTCTYPAYENGWHVTASPDGTLTDKEGKEYNYLYWEGEISAEYDLSSGFCIKGEDTALFLEDALAKLGLDRREANEFIVYWLPLMEKNPYNIISFQFEAYTDAASLHITPEPDTLIRVFMTFRASQDSILLPPQVLTSPHREGFVAVEWGGTELK